MAVSDQQKIDFLLKKIGYTKTKTGSVDGTGSVSGTPKQPFAEAIASPLVVPNSSLWNEADSIPATPPGSDTNQVKVYSTTSAIRMTADATSSGNRAYIAYSTYNDTSSARLTNWIDTQFGSLYLIKVFKNDPTVPANNLSAGATNENWFFDYSAGVLNFNDQTVPSHTDIYIVGYRYIGQTGAPSSGISTFSFLDLTVERNLDVGKQGGISTFRNNLDVSSTSTFSDNIFVGTGATVGFGSTAYFNHNVEIANDRILKVGEIGIKWFDVIDAAYISTPSGSGNQLIIQSPGITLQDGTGNKYFKAASTNTRLFHNGPERLRTTDNGISISNGIIPGTSNPYLGTMTSLDVNTSFLNVSGNSVFSGISTFTDIDVDGHTNLDNVSIAGVTTFADGVAAKFGTDGDLEIFHNNAHAVISNTTGNLHIKDSVIKLQGSDSSAMVIANQGSSVELYHNNDFKFQTTSSGIEVTGTTDTDGLVVSGVSTFTGAIDANGDLDVDGHTNLDNVSIAGVSTFAGDLTISSTLPRITLNDTNHESDYEIKNENGSFRIRDIDNPTDRYRINNSGTIHEFFGTADFNSNLTVDGVFTANGNIDANGDIDVDGHTNLDNVSIAGVTTGTTINATTFVGNGDFVELDVDGHTNLDNVNIAGVTTTSGLLDINAGGQANTFKVEDLTSGRVVLAGTGGELEDSNKLTFDGTTLGLTGNANFTGNLTVGGVLTYEDVKNVDAVGLITARSGIRVTSGVIEAQAGENKIPSLYSDLTNLPSASTYHGLFAHVHATGRGYFAHAANWLELVNKETNGVVGTGTETYNIGNLVSTSSTTTSLNVTGVTTAVTVDINGDLDVDGHTNLDNVSVAGVTTFGNFINLDGDDREARFGAGNDLAIKWDGSKGGVYTDEFRVKDRTNNVNMLAISKTGALRAYHNGSNRLDTTTAGIEVFGSVVATGADINGDLDVDGHTNLDNVNIAGVVTATTINATTFVGNGDFVELDVDGHTNLDNVSISGIATVGILTATTLRGLNTKVFNVLEVDGPAWFDGGAEFGTRTYNKGYASIDTLGIATFSGISVSGVSTFFDIDVDGHTELDNINISGVVTATNFAITSNGQVNMGGNLTQANYPVQITTVHSNEKISFYRAQHDDLNDEGAGIAFARKDTGAELASGLFSHSNGGLGVAAIQDIVFLTGGSAIQSTEEALRITSTGSINIKNDLDVSGSVKGYDYLVAPHSGITTITVTVDSKTSAHRYYNVGSGNGYYFDGYESPFITLTPGRTYRFDQSANSNGSHQIRFYHEADKTTLYEDGVTYNGTAGNSGAYTQIVVTDKTPTVLHYMCVNHPYMGNAAQLNSSAVITSEDAQIRANFCVKNSGISTFTGQTNFTSTTNFVGVATFGNTIDANGNLDVDGQTDLDVLNVAEIATFKDDVEFHGVSGITSVRFDKSDNALEFVDDAKLVIGTGDDLILTHNGSVSSLINYTGVFKLENTASNIGIYASDSNGDIIIRAGGATSGENAIVAVHHGEVVLSFNGNTKLTTTNTGINVTGLTDTDTLTTGDATFTGTITAGGSTGNNGQYLKSTGTGVAWENYPAARTATTYTATAGQTTFAFNYNVGYLDVFVNGVKLTASEFTAVNGTSVILGVGLFAGDTVDLASYNTIVSGQGASLANVIEDLTPELGGNLSLNSKNITGTGNININGQVNATTFVGDGSGLTGVVGSGSGVIVKDSGATVGTAGTINFGAQLELSTISNASVTVGVDTNQFNVNNFDSTGISTFRDIDVDGHTELDNVNVSGVITATTFSGTLSGNASGLSGTPSLTLLDVDVDGHTELDNVNVSGVITATTYKGAIQATSGTFSSHVDVTGDLDVDGHTNLDNLSVSGISTFSAAANTLNVNTTTTNPALNIQRNGTTVGSLIPDSDGLELGVNTSDNLLMHLAQNGGGNSDFIVKSAGTELFKIDGTTGEVDIVNDLDVDGHTNLDNVSIAGVCTAASFVGDGSGLTGVTASGVGIEIKDSGSVVGTAGTIDFGGNLSVSPASAGIVTITSSGGVISDAQNNTVAGTNAGDAFSGTDATNNTLFGFDAGTDINTGDNNVFIGYQAGANATSSSNAVAIGYQALFNMTASRNYQTAVGYQALRSNAHGQECTAVGYQALYSNNIGDDQCAFGVYSLQNSNKQYNSAFGYKSLMDNTNGEANSAFGCLALENNTGDYNCGFGYKAGDTIGAGSNNLCLGYNAQPSSGTVSNEITLGNANVTKFRIPGIDVVLKDNGGTPSQGHVLTVDGSGEASFVAASGGADVGISTNISGSFTASVGTPATINTFTGYSSDDLVIEYTIYIKNGSNFQTQKLLAMRDGTTIHSTQFAVMFSSTLLVQCDATISSGNILLRATPETGVSGSTTFKIKREVM